MQAVEGAGHALQVQQSARLRQFNLKRLRRKSCLRKDRADGAIEVCDQELARRQIHCHADITEPSIAPVPRLGDGGAQHLLPYLHDEPGLLQQRDEFLRADHSVLRMRPAQ